VKAPTEYTGAAIRSNPNTTSDETRKNFISEMISSCSRAHLTRAVIEGISFGIRDIFALMNEAGLRAIDQVRVSGGGAKSVVWRQILADILGTELVTVNTTEGAAYGAALLAGVAAGNWSNVDEACAHTIRVTDSVSPNPANTSRYDEIYRHYQSLYPSLRSVSHALSAIESSTAQS